MKITEKDIPLLIKTGQDQQVISLLYKNIFPKVKKYVVSHGGIADDASDVFQDSIMYLYSQIVSGKYDEEKYTIYGYLFTLSKNRWLNKLKRSKRITSVENYDESLAEAISDADFQFVDEINTGENLIRSIFSGLGEKCIELLTYDIFYNMLMEDIVLRMGFPSAGAAKMQLKRCKEKLNLELEQKPEIKSRLLNELS
jgi:DNA-directed RNA polymerase specialized sigma24 family protein